MRPLLACLLAGGLAAQELGDLLTKAPPEADAALRARVSQFYELQRARKWRQAETLVHPESREIFFIAEKFDLREFKIVRLSWSENFTRARAVIDADTDLIVPGSGRLAVNRPVASQWRLDDGEWRWYVEPIAAEPDDAATAGEGVIGTRRAMESFHAAVADLQARVRLDRDEPTLPSYEAADREATIVNAWDARVRLTIDAPDRSGLALRLDRDSLEPGESAKLTVRSRPETRGLLGPVEVRIMAEPLALPLTLRLRYLPPPPPAGKQ